MNIVFRPESLFLFPTLFSSLTHHQPPKCLSSVAPKTPHLEPPLNPLPPTFFSPGKNQKKSRNAKPDYELPIISVLRDCSSNFLIPRGRQIHGLVIKLGLDSNIFVQNSLISFYSQCELIYSAKKIFDDFGKLDAVSCNIMIAGYVKSGYLNDTRELFDKMPGRNCVTFTTMIMGLANNGFWSEAIEVFGDMRFSGGVSE
ncbi:hypothetical protein ACH5RR_031234 [Cinchona calisaya]|uniref:Pentatricopeptide repeat-containing protein n=1 Tax=Cinchona calisaya TaxID=153742 RepID=A0ABD2YHM6_9GENT